MEASDLKRWMIKNKKTVVDVASATKTHPQTVQRFIDGKPAHASTREAFRRLVVEQETIRFGGKKVSVV